MIALGFSLPQQKPSLPTTHANVPTVQVNVIQQVSQLTETKIDQLIDMIQQQQGISSDVKVAATSAVKEFNAEIAQPKPQASKLKACLDIVLKAGTQFGIPLLFKILENWDKIFH